MPVGCGWPSTARTTSTWSATSAASTWRWPSSPSLALITGSTLVARAAGGAALIYGVPHLLYHATHLDPYDTGDKVALIVSLSIAVLAAVLAVAAPTDDDPATV